MRLRAIHGIYVAEPFLLVFRAFCPFQFVCNICSPSSISSPYGKSFTQDGLSEEGGLQMKVCKSFTLCHQSNIPSFLEKE